MCGIVGCFGKDIHPESTRPVIGSMIQAIAHRGPDERGKFLEPGVGLGHASPSYARGHGHRPAFAVKQAPLPSARIALCGLIRTRTLSTRCGWMVRAPRAARPAVQGPDFCSWNARRLNSSASGQHEASATRMRLAVSTMRPAIFKRCRRMLVNSLWRSGCQDGT